MSRSYRKHPILKDGGRQRHEDKQLASRKFRHVVKDKMSSGEFEILPEKHCETTDPYGVCDRISRYTEQETVDRFIRLGPSHWWGNTEEEASIKWKKEFYWK